MDKETLKLINEYKLKIMDCKRDLRATDYKALKYAEGELSFEEYEPTLIERRELRVAINSYEQRIAELKGEAT